MNKFYIIILSTAVSFGQLKTENKVDTSRISDLVLKPTISSKIDTVKIKNLTTTPSVIPIDKKNDTRVVIVKESIEADYLKYILPIITFLFGFFVNIFSNWIRRRRKIKKSGRTFLLTLKSVEGLLTQQQLELHSFIGQVKNAWQYKPLVLVKDTLNGEYLLSFDRSDIADYIEINKGKHSWIKKVYYKITGNNKIVDDEEYRLLQISNKVYNFINVLVHQYETLNKKWESFNEGVAKTTHQFNSDFESFTKEMTTYFYKLKKEGIDVMKDEGYQDLYLKYTSLLDLAKTKDYNPLTLHTDFIIPFSKILHKYSSDDRTIPIALAITTLANDVQLMNYERDYIIRNGEILDEQYEDLIRVQLPKVIILLSGK